MPKWSLFYISVDKNKEVWLKTGPNNPVPTNHSIESFISAFKNNVYNEGCYRIPAYDVNLPLIIGLSPICFTKPNYRLYICKPRIIPSSETDPIFSISAARNWSRSISFGGWRLFTYRDYGVFALRNYIINKKLFHMNNSELTHDKMVQQFLKQVVIYPAIKFFKYINIPKLVFLLASILDPRFFRDSQRPYSCCRLLSYLGLYNKNIFKAFYYSDKYENAKRWPLFYSSSTFWLPTTKPKEIVAFYKDTKDYFCGLLVKGEFSPEAIYRTIKKVIKYLFLIWCDFLSFTHFCRIFIPEKFFDEKTAEIWRNETT
ncbi:MAG: hypothetical protein QXH92_04700 [Candidatus Aenigmatarchaeota archaeon]